MKNAFRVELQGEIDDIFVSGQRDSCQVHNPEGRVIIPGRVVVRKNGNALYLNGSCVPEIKGSVLQVKFESIPPGSGEDSWGRFGDPNDRWRLALNFPLSRVTEFGFVESPTAYA